MEARVAHVPGADGAYVEGAFGERGIAQVRVRQGEAGVARGTVGGLAALVELPLLVYAVCYVGGNWQRIMEAMGRFQGVLAAAFALAVLLPRVLARRRRRAQAQAGEAARPNR